MRFTREEFNKLVVEQRKGANDQAAAEASKQKLREQLERDVAKFVAKGGVITELPTSENKIDKPKFTHCGTTISSTHRNEQKMETRKIRLNKQRPMLEAYLRKNGLGCWPGLADKTGNAVSVSQLSRCHRGDYAIGRGWEKLEMVLNIELEGHQELPKKITGSRKDQASGEDVKRLREWLKVRKGRGRDLAKVLGVFQGQITQVISHTRTCSIARMKTYLEAMKKVEAMEAEAEDLAA